MISFKPGRPYSWMKHPVMMSWLNQTGLTAEWSIWVSLVLGFLVCVFLESFCSIPWLFVVTILSLIGKSAKLGVLWSVHWCKLRSDTCATKQTTPSLGHCSFKLISLITKVKFPGECVNQSSPRVTQLCLFQDDEEWKDFEEEKKVDYTGLRIQNLQMSWVRFCRTALCASYCSLL